MDTKKALDNKGESLTSILQSLIDQASLAKETLTFVKGDYLTGPLFIPSHMKIIFQKGARLISNLENEKIDLIQTRVAGIEMEWYPGILNILSKEDVWISGEGIIDGKGEYFYHKYWGEDTKSGMRKEYDSRGLRWAADYDCKRLRNILVSDSNDIHLCGFTSYRSGFWNIHILYSNKVFIDSVNIDSSLANSPSTDGIDIDSSKNVSIKGCKISVNDDSISIKSGRDNDGLRVNRPSEGIVIDSCSFFKGYGVSLGSELSGGIKGVEIKNCVYKGTDCGLRIKSSSARKGYVQDVFFHDCQLEDVKYIFIFSLNWNPLYCKCELPLDYKGEVKDYYLKLMDKVDESIPNTSVDDIRIDNIKANLSSDYKGISRIFNIEGFKDSPIKSLYLSNCHITANEYGLIKYVDNISFHNCSFEVTGKEDRSNDQFDNR